MIVNGYTAQAWNSAEKLRAIMQACQAKGVRCGVCEQARARLAELDELTATVAPEHRALSSGALK